MKKQITKKGMSTGVKIGIGAGIAAAGVVTYLLLGPDGKKNRKKVRTWAVKVKGEVIKKLTQAKKITEPLYHNIIDQVHAKYAKVKDIDKKELALLMADIRKHWKAMSKGMTSKPKPKTRVTSKPKTKRKKK
jgi:gas vesicle protein